AALPVAWAGTKEQRERWLPALASGQEVGAFALTEAGSGSDVGALATAATPGGDGYRLDGDKVLISGARAATMLVVFARTGAAGLREATASGTRLPAEASMAKLFATEAAGRIVDAALQLHGGAGVVSGAVVERLYREVRALRIYEGASEIQKLVIARTML